MKIWLILSIMLATLAGTAIVATVFWTGVDDVEISASGMIALILGTVVTLALGIGLMALVFYSSRKGYDDPDRRG